MARTQIKTNQAEQEFLTEQEHAGIGNNTPHHPKGHSLHSANDHVDVDTASPSDGALPVYEASSGIWKYRNTIPGGNRTVNTKTITTPAYTITNSDYLLVCDNVAAGGSITLTLPPVSKIDFYIVKSKASHKVIINGNDAPVNGEASLEIQSRYDSVHIVGDTEWYII